MGKTEEIFDAMRRCGMNDWVGGYDPASVARNSFAWVVENLSLRPSDRVLDFGCGIGRTSVLLLEFLTTGELVGVDIVPAQIHFCRSEISSRFRNASYYCTNGKNPLYDHLISADSVVISENDFLKTQAASFDLIIASSVFTHFDPTMACNYLCLLRQLTKEGGYLGLSWLFDHKANPPDKRLLSGEHFRNIDNLTYSLFSLKLFEDLVDNSGLVIQQITYGSWRGLPHGKLKGQHLQDVAILYRPSA